MSHIATDGEISADPVVNVAEGPSWHSTPRARRSWSHLVDVIVPTIAALPAAYIVAVVAKGAFDRFVPAGGGSELRASGLDHFGISKNSEWVFVFLLWPVLVGIAASLDRRYRRSGGVTEWERTAWRVLALPAAAVLIPMVTGLATAPVVPILQNALFFAIWLQIPVLVTCATRAWRSSAGRPTAGSAWALLLMSAATAFAGPGVAVLLQQVTVPGGLGTGLSIAIAAAVTVLLAVAVGLASGLPSDARLRILPLGFGALGVASLPLLLPPLLRSASGLSVAPGVDSRAWALALVVVAAGMVGVSVLASRRSARTGRLWVPSLSVAALLVPLRVVYALPSINPDDYHFGEYISPFVLWSDFGQAPMVDVTLPRGVLLNVFPQFVNSALNDGSAAAFSYTRPMVALLVCAAAVFLLGRAVGLPPAVAIVALMAVSNGSVDGDLFVGAIMVWSIAVVVRRRQPLVSGAVLAVLAVVALLSYPMMGIISLGALGGVAVAGVLGAALARDRSTLANLMWGLGAFAAVLIAVVLTPARDFLVAAVTYVTSNAGSNAHSWGIPVELLWDEKALGVGQLVHTGFAAAFAVSAVVLFRQRHDLRRPGWARYSFLAVAAVPAVVAVVLFTRYMGRIDIEALPNRAVAGTLFTIGLVTPAMLLVAGRSSFRRVAWAVIGCAALLSAIWHPIGQGGLFANVRGEIDRPETWPSERAASVMPRLGLGTGSDEHFSTLMSIHQAAQDLAPGEPVLNVSNQGALFAYQGWSTPISYLAPFNIESASAEARVVAEAEEARPQYVFIGPGQSFDYSPLMLRNPALGRWLVDNYTPFTCGDTTWATIGVGPSWSGTGDLVCPEASAPPSAQESAYTWATTVGALGDLGMLPSSWSADLGPESGIELPLERTDEGGDFATYDIDPAALPADWQGMVVLQSRCSSGAGEPAQLADDMSQSTRAFLMWPSVEGMEWLSQAVFSWGEGTFVVPVDAYPVWQLRAPGGRMVLTVPTTGCDGVWDVTARAVDR